MLGGRAVGRGHQHVGEVELLAGGSGCGGERGIHLGLAHVDAALGEALAQLLGDDLVAQVVAETGERHAILGQPRAQLVDVHAVLLGDAANRLLQLLVAHRDAGVGGPLDLQAGQDQPFEHLALEHVGRRQLVFLAGVLGADVGDRAIQFAAQDHVLVHHRGDAIHRRSAGIALRLRGGREQQAGEGNGKEGTMGGLAHGLASVTVSMSGGEVWPEAVCGGTR